MLVPSGKHSALANRPGNLVHANWKMKPPDEVKTLKSLTEYPIHWRMPGIEVCPQYDWLALGMTYHRATSAEWLNPETT